MAFEFIFLFATFSIWIITPTYSLYLGGKLAIFQIPKAYIYRRGARLNFSKFRTLHNRRRVQNLEILQVLEPMNRRRAQDISKSKMQRELTPRYARCFVHHEPRNSYIQEEENLEIFRSPTACIIIVRKLISKSHSLHTRGELEILSSPTAHI